MRSVLFLGIASAVILGALLQMAPAAGRSAASPAVQAQVPPKQDPPKQDPPQPNQKLDMIKLEASFDAELLPIFEHECAECHDAGEAERELQLLSFAALLKGSVNGPIIEPGKSAESKLFKVIQEGSDPHMPPDEQLEKEDLERIQKWIDGLPAALKDKLGKRK